VLSSFVLLGLKRDDKSGKVWFLLQRSWACKHLVVVSAESLAACCAEISFAPKVAKVTPMTNFQSPTHIAWKLKLDQKRKLSFMKSPKSYFHDFEFEFHSAGKGVNNFF